MSTEAIPEDWRGLDPEQRTLLRDKLARAVEQARRGLWVPYPWQVPPENIPAHGMWLLLGGRGTGKTDGAARYVNEHVRGPACDPRLKGGHRVAIVAPTLGDAVESCVNGPSGLKAHDPTARLTGGVGGVHVRWPNGAEAKLFGAHLPDDIERLRSGGNRCVAHGTLVETADGPKPIQQVQAGDRVWTRRGLREVLHAGQTGVRELWGVFAGDRTVYLTGDHEVWTEGHGWVRADLLKPTHTVLTWTYGPTPSLAPPPSSGTASPGGSAMTATTATPGEGSCTGPSTAPYTDPSPEAGRSTTGTTTSSTTTRTTSCCSQQPSTGPSTTTNGDRTGTPEAARPPGRTASPAPTPAPCAGSSSPAGASPPPKSARAGAENAGTPTPVPAEHTRNGCAWCAEHLSAPATTPPSESSPRLATAPVQHVWRTGIVAPVYDLTVAHDHEFIAGSLLVANCLVWLEEAAAMRYLGDALHHTAFGLRIGPTPHFVASTTPKPRKELRALLANPLTMVTRGRTAEAHHLDQGVRDELFKAYAGTRLGRQELDGDLLDDVEGALWRYDHISAGRVTPKEAPDYTRVVVAMDPAVSVTETSDETGLVAAGMGTDRHVYVLADRSKKMAGTDAARAAWLLWLEVNADVLVYEDNQGKRWVADVLRQVWSQMQGEGLLPPGNAPLEGVTAMVGKRLRAEPMATLYEPPMEAHHVGVFQELEDQMTTWVPETGGSPDRLDALVHALTYLAGRAAIAQVASPVGLSRLAIAGAGRIGSGIGGKPMRSPSTRPVGRRRR